MGNGTISNASPYTHFTYFYQDWLTYWPSYNATIAHVSYQYDTFSGPNSSYLEQQDWRNYKSTQGSNKVRPRCLDPVAEDSILQSVGQQ